MSYNEWEFQLTKFFLINIEAEREVEYLRTELGRLSLFEPYAAFKRIDRHNNKKIDMLDITRFLRYKF